MVSLPWFQGFLGDAVLRSKSHHWMAASVSRILAREYADAGFLWEDWGTRYKKGEKHDV